MNPLIELRSPSIRSWGPSQEEIDTIGFVSYSNSSSGNEIFSLRAGCPSSSSAVKEALSISFAKKETTSSLPVEFWILFKVSTNSSQNFSTANRKAFNSSSFAVKSLESGTFMVYPPKQIFPRSSQNNHIRKEANDD